MVQQGDMEVRLVHASTTTSLAFPEHMNKDNGQQVYVEVEPEQEYFVCIQRIGSEVDGPLLARISVDGRRLPHHHYFKEPTAAAAGGGVRSGPPTYHGLWMLQEDGVTWTNTALKFTKPPRNMPAATPTGRGKKQQQPQQQHRSSLLTMGRVQVEIYKALVVVDKSSSSNSNKKSPPTPKAWKASIAAGSIAKKGLRTGPGTMSLTQMASRNNKQQQQQRTERTTYKRGPQIYVFTLNYCAASELIAAGVVDKPPPWVYHRTKLSTPNNNKKKRSATAAGMDTTSPATSTATTASTAADDSTTSTSTTTTQIIRTHELVDLSKGNGDSDDSCSDDDEEDNNDDNDIDDDGESSSMVELNV